MPVGTYIDEIYVSRINSNNFGFLDVDRVEVLRGPQGTLFGRNTAGGAVNVILKKPGKDFGGFLDAGFGSFNRYTVQGALDVPVTPKLLTRVAGYVVKSDGFVKNATTGGKQNADNEYGLRGAIQFAPTETIMWTASVNLFASKTLNLLNFACSAPVAGAPANCDGRYTVSGLGPRRSGQTTLTNLQISVPGVGLVPTTLANGKNDTDYGLDTRSLLLASNFAIEAGSATINLITGYTDLKQDYLFDFEDGRQGRSLALLNPLIIEDAAGVRSPNGSPLVLEQRLDGVQFTQEVKITGAAFGDRIKYVAGAYYLNEANTSDPGDVSTNFVAGTGPRPYISTVGADRTIRSQTKAYAGYVQVDGKITDELTATTGVRYTDETKSFAIADQRDPRVAPVIGGVTRFDLRLTTANLIAFGIPTELSTKRWTPRFALNFQPTRDILLFATAARGFRSGGYNARGTEVSQLVPYAPESVWSYELGVKSELFDRRLRLNATAFQVDISGLQIPSQLVTAAGATIFITRNDADLRNRGVELEIEAAPISGALIYANLGYQDANCRGLPTATINQAAACRALRATRSVGLGTCASGIVTAQGEIAKPVGAPSFTLAAGASYEIPVRQWGLKFIPAINATYSTRYETAVANLTFYRSAAGVVNVDGNGILLGGARSFPTTFITASVAIATLDDKWRLLVECTNCTDTVRTESGVTGYAYVGPPRAINARLKRAF